MHVHGLQALFGGYNFKPDPSRSIRFRSNHDDFQGKKEVMISFSINNCHT